ncbi:hypothetical protein MPH_12672 [Macrophomina phaseolina MS6]|uniref:Uncharacterized protein n=1 Tax=Macrophomina phaseolina (strain MS6) TaxID=1126212 RepID=K2RBH7_MACPH|nr:hypothetical protein MPH_12672 [Macrophomina phaseolina MS6]
MTMKATMLILNIGVAATIAAAATTTTTAKELASPIQAATCRTVSPAGLSNIPCQNNAHAEASDDGKHHCVEECIKLWGETACLGSYCAAQGRSSVCNCTCGSFIDCD